MNLFTEVVIPVGGTSFINPRKDAKISICGTYRYRLTRVWDENKFRVLWVMLNPSTADATVDDPTCKKCMAFAKAWGYGGIEIVNLFALRATDPRELRSHAAPIGPDNLRHIKDAVSDEANGMVVCAWGNNAVEFGKRSPLSGHWRNVTEAMVNHERALNLYCLQCTGAGMPQHPLYIAGATVPHVWMSEVQL